MNGEVLSIVVFLALFGFGIYEMYRGVKQLMEHNKNRKEYMENHNKPYDFFEEYKLWFTIYSGVAVFSIGACIYQAVNYQDWMYAMGFLVLAACCVSFAMDCLVKRRAWFYEEGFFYEKKFYRYRSVARVSKTTGFKPGYDVNFMKDPSMIVTKKMALEIQKRMEAYKANKKKGK